MNPLVPFAPHAPLTWRRVRLDRMFTPRRESPREGDELVSAFIDGRVTARSNRPDAVIKGSGMEVGYKRIAKGDLAISGMNAHLGGLGISDSDGRCSPVYLVLRPVIDLDSTFCSYLLRHMALSGFIRSLVQTIRFNSSDFKHDDLKKLTLPMPPLEVQRAIADHLDTETARIDALIDKKQRMVELLDERFLSEGRLLITGGSPGDGCSTSQDWSGPVPHDWQLMKIASFARLGSGTTPASDDDEYYNDDGLAWVTTAELRETVITDTARGVTEQALHDYSALKVFPVGSVLVAMYGATVGRVGVLGVPATTNQACCAIYEAVDLNLRFVFWWLVLNRQNLLDLAYGAGQPNISQETARSLRIPAPNFVEQGAIAERLDTEAGRLRNLRATLQRQIDMLREHRQALITAAVTGELEIPGVAA